MRFSRPLALSIVSATRPAAKLLLNMQQSSARIRMNVEKPICRAFRMMFRKCRSSRSLSCASFRLEQDDVPELVLDVSRGY
jgi:Fe-S cluster assembly iron-binding protein IscA